MDNDNNFDGYDMNIQITKYCIMVLGKVEGVKDEISKIAHEPARYMDARGLVISVFKSVMNTKELNDYFKLHNRSFLLFEMGEDNYGAHLNEKFNKFLFGIQPEIEPDLSDDILSTIENNYKSILNNSINTPKSSGITGVMTGIKVEPKESEEEVFNKLTEVQKKNRIDAILEKISTHGIKELSDIEVKILKKFT